MRSNSPTKIAKATENTTTTVVELTRSSRVGQMTLVNSDRTSLRKVLILSHIPVCRYPPLYPPADGAMAKGGKTAGLAGLEPATAGFGDRCSTN